MAALIFVGLNKLLSTSLKKACDLLSQIPIASTGTAFPTKPAPYNAKFVYTKRV